MWRGDARAEQNVEGAGWKRMGMGVAELTVVMHKSLGAAGAWALRVGV